MKRISLLMLGIIAAAGLLVVWQPNLAGAATAQQPVTSNVAASSIASKQDICDGIGITGADCNDKGSGLNGVIKAVLNILSIAVGIAAIVMIIIAGLKYITSAGDANGIASAKNTLLYAIVGLVIVAFAQVIVKFVLEKTK